MFAKNVVKISIEMTDIMILKVLLYVNFAEMITLENVIKRHDNVWQIVNEQNGGLRMKLYDIADTYRRLMDCMQIDPETGEISTPEVLDALDAQDAAFDVKAEAVACYIKELRADAKALKEEEEVLRARRYAMDRKADSLSQYLADCMMQIGRNKVQTSRCALSFRKNSQVQVTDLDLLASHEEFMRVKTPEPDKTAIKAALKNGRIVPGAELITTHNLQIK